MELLTALINQSELISGTQRVQRRRAFGLLTHFAPGLIVARCQPLTTLRTASLKYEPASLRTHPLTEAVGLGSTPVIWLKCSFHS